MSEGMSDSGYPTLTPCPNCGTPSAGIHGYPPIGERGQSWEAGYDAGWVDGKKRLESQNQALQQEESDRWRLIAAENEAEFRRLGTQNQALQERITDARKYVTENGLVMMNTPATWHRFVDEILQLLSPTQETDPE